MRKTETSSPILPDWQFPVTPLRNRLHQPEFSACGMASIDQTRSACAPPGHAVCYPLYSSQKAEGRGAAPDATAADYYERQRRGEVWQRRPCLQRRLPVAAGRGAKLLPRERPAGNAPRRWVAGIACMEKKRRRAVAPTLRYDLRGHRAAIFTIP